MTTQQAAGLEGERTTQVFLKMLAARGGKPLEQLSPVAAREAIARPCG